MNFGKENLGLEDFKGTVIEKSFKEFDIIKGGEGSKGGNIIGHTRSGKPIYDSYNHEGHKEFNAEDHRDAGKLHQHLRDTTKNFTSKDQNKRLDAKVSSSEHDRQASHHNSKHLEMIGKKDFSHEKV